MWNNPSDSLIEKLVAPSYNPEWVLMDKNGPELIKHEIKYFRSVFPDLKYRIVEINGEKDKVWIHYSATGTHLGKAWGFEPTNKQVTFEGASILYINEEGQVIDQWGAFCFYDIFTDLGLVPPFWELKNILNPS